MRCLSVLDLVFFSILFYLFIFFSLAAIRGCRSLLEIVFCKR